MTLSLSLSYSYSYSLLLFRTNERMVSLSLSNERTNDLSLSLLLSLSLSLLLSFTLSMYSKQLFEDGRELEEFLGYNGYINNKYLSVNYIFSVNNFFYQLIISFLSKNALGYTGYINNKYHPIHYNYEFIYVGKRTVLTFFINLQLSLSLLNEGMISVSLFLSFSLPLSLSLFRSLSLSLYHSPLFYICNNKFINKVLAILNHSTPEIDYVTRILCAAGIDRLYFLYVSM